MFLIDKPSGITSFDVVEKVRQKTGIKKVGHAGTLDPMATGLLIVLVGKNETRKQNELMKKDKTYIAKIRIGQQYDTLDLDGILEKEQEVVNLDLGLVKAALKKIEGEHEFEVPRYSAIKLKGKRLYQLARENKEFQPPKKLMKVYSAKLLNLEKVTINNKNMYEAEIEFDVGSGTYIRTLAAELGKILDLPASLSFLRRTRIGAYHVKDAILLEEFVESDIENIKKFDIF